MPNYRAKEVVLATQDKAVGVRSWMVHSTSGTHCSIVGMGPAGDFGVRE